MATIIPFPGRHDDSPRPEASCVRRLAQKAGLLSFRANAFQLTKLGRAALDANDSNEIYRRLLEAYLSNPGIIDRYDRIPIGNAVARCAPLLLFAAVHDELSVYGEELDAAVRLRFFDRFGAHFGLFEEGPAFTPPGLSGGIQVDHTPFVPVSRTLGWESLGVFLPGSADRLVAEPEEL